VHEEASGRHARTASARAVWLALAAVYVIWGSTYLAILFVLETLPPFTMAGARFLTAGLILITWRLLAGDAAPTRSQWAGGWLTGTLMLLGGNGAVVWAEQRVSSGLAALLVASVPAWMVVLDALRPKGRRPTGLLLLGLILGFVGVALLVVPRVGGSGEIDPLGAGVLIFGSCCWASGSLLSREVPLPKSPLLSTALQMLGGGASLLVVGFLAGEPSRIALANVSTKSWVSLAYLVVFGSLVAFSCYAWLLRVTTPALVSTYAYVNPVVAVALGVLLAHERFSALSIVASAFIVAGVVSITIAKTRAASPQRVLAEESP
jgi:drug/metabolite transporter (DMT)-like permease